MLKVLILYIGFIVIEITAQKMLLWVVCTNVISRQSKIPSFISLPVTAKAVKALKRQGAGKWSVVSVARCADAAAMPWVLDVRRRRLNRTHEALSADIKTDATLDDTYALVIEVCRKVDGGCKPYMTMADDSLAAFIKKHAEDNMREALTLAGIKPPDFPIAAGEYHMNNYILNTDTLPEDGLYGDYGTTSYILKDGAKMACVALNTRYEPVDGPSPLG